MRPIIAGAVVGSSAGAPVKLWPLLTVSRLVPSLLISARRPAWEEADRPSTATRAATPMAMPRADSPARSFRVRRPTVESRVRSESGRRRRFRVAVAVTFAPRCRSCQTLFEEDAGVEEPVGDVVEHGGVLGQEELLEDDPDPGGPQVGHVFVGHRCHV